MLASDTGAEHHPIQSGTEQNTISELEETDMYYDQKESGKRIAALRKKKGLTQEQLAEKLNISTSTLGKIERGI